MLRRLAAVTLATLVVTGCARVSTPGAGGDPTSDPESPVSSAPGDPGSPGPSPSPRVVEPRDGLVDPHPSAFDRAAAVDEDSVRVEFSMGVEECYGLDRVDVEYGRDVVVLTLFVGRVPGDHACIEIAEFVVTTVDLAEPLGGREIRDGAADS